MARRNQLTILASNNENLIAAAASYRKRTSRRCSYEEALTLVCGTVWKLLLFTWFNMNDLLGETYEEVEQVAGMPDGGHMALALHDGGIIEKAGDYFFMPWSVPLAPEHCRDAWCRNEPETYKLAMARRKGGGEMLGGDAPLADKPSDEVIPRDLFGNPLKERMEIHEPEKRPAVKPPSEHKDFIEWWSNEFSVRRQYQYPFIGAADGSAVSRMLKAVGLERLKVIAGSYLRCEEPFYRGWPLTKLAQNLSRFAGEASGARSGKDYGGEREGSLKLAGSSSVASNARDKSRGGGKDSGSGLRTREAGTESQGVRAIQDASPSVEH